MPEKCGVATVHGNGENFGAVPKSMKELYREKIVAGGWLNRFH